MLLPLLSGNGERALIVVFVVCVCVDESVCLPILSVANVSCL